MHLPASAMCLASPSHSVVPLVAPENRVVRFLGHAWQLVVANASPPTLNLPAQVWTGQYACVDITASSVGWFAHQRLPISGSPSPRLPISARDAPAAVIVARHMPCTAAFIRHIPCTAASSGTHMQLLRPKTTHAPCNGLHVTAPTCSELVLQICTQQGTTNCTAACMWHLHLHAVCAAQALRGQLLLTNVALPEASLLDDTSIQLVGILHSKARQREAAVVDVVNGGRGHVAGGRGGARRALPALVCRLGVGRVVGACRHRHGVG